MPITVHFATNRALTGPADQVASYSAGIVAPTDPTAVVYGSAFVADAQLTADTDGAITSIQDITMGGFSDSARGDISAPGRNLLVFIHGFNNTFQAAITRAAFITQWFAGSGVPGTDASVVAFSWPSLGKLFSFPDLEGDYRTDQRTAGLSGPHLMSFFANLQPLLAAARQSGRRVILVAHSMGNWVLQAGLDNWFAHNNGPAMLFDAAVLAAADEVYDSFSYPLPGRLSGLTQFAGQVSTYFSRADQALILSNLVNLVQRLGQDGPLGDSDTTKFPPALYRTMDCTACQDYDFNASSSHEYYRRSPTVRIDIAKVIAGA
jgi:esterase/lipase superfamily enzyme